MSVGVRIREWLGFLGLGALWAWYHCCWFSPSAIVTAGGGMGVHAGAGYLLWEGSWGLACLALPALCRRFPRILSRGGAALAGMGLVLGTLLLYGVALALPQAAGEVAGAIANGVDPSGPVGTPAAAESAMPATASAASVGTATTALAAALHCTGAVVTGLACGYLWLAWAMRFGRLEEDRIEVVVPCSFASTAVLLPVWLVVTNEVIRLLLLVALALWCVVPLIVSGASDVGVADARLTVAAQDSRAFEAPRRLPQGRSFAEICLSMLALYLFTPFVVSFAPAGYFSSWETWIALSLFLGVALAIAFYLTLVNFGRSLDIVSVMQACLALYMVALACIAAPAQVARDAGQTLLTATNCLLSVASLTYFARLVSAGQAGAGSFASLARGWAEMGTVVGAVAGIAAAWAIGEGEGAVAQDMPWVLWVAAALVVPAVVALTGRGNAFRPEMAHAGAGSVRLRESSQEPAPMPLAPDLEVSGAPRAIEAMWGSSPESPRDGATPGFSGTTSASPQGSPSSADIAMSQADLLATRPAVPLTPREREILALVLQGRNVPYIRDALCISRNTVNVHMKHIFQKFDVHSRQELIDRVRGA